jgi:autotransporter-associated beta strand protein
VSSDLVSTNISYTATGLLPDTTYYYIFRATNASDVTWSPQVSSFKTHPPVPVITAHPVSRTNVAGSPASFSVTASDASHHQWYKDAVALVNGATITGTTLATLQIIPVTAADAGNYHVVVSNITGSVTSTVASLMLVPAANLTWDANTGSSGAQDGAGTWIGNNWWNGSANVSWLDNHDARIGSGGTGGGINLGTVMVNNLVFTNFSGTYTISNGTLTVVSNLVFESSASAKLSAIIAGTATLTKNGAGTLTLDGVSPNTYSGGTIVNAGTLVLGTVVDGLSPICSFAAGSGPVTLNSGAQINTHRVSPANALILNGGTIRVVNGWGSTWLGPVALNTNTTLTADHSFPFSVVGNITGSGGITKAGNHTLTLSGSNTFSGTTSVQAGKITYANAASLAPGPLSISSGRSVDLNYSGTRLLGSLTLNGVAQPYGTYGSTNSTATYKSAYFGGAGTITVTNYPVVFHGNGHTGGTVPATQTKNPGINLSLATNSGGLVRTGHVLSGWNTATNGSGIHYAEAAIYTADAAVTLYARWIPQPTITAWPTATAISLGQPLSASMLSGGSTSVPGTFAFTSPETVPGLIGTYLASVTFTPSDLTSYAPVTGSVPVAVDGVQSIPFLEYFETLTLGDLNGQNDWLSAGVIVQTNLSYAGGQAAEIVEKDGYL